MSLRNQFNNMRQVSLFESARWEQLPDVAAQRKYRMPMLMFGGDNKITVQLFDIILQTLTHFDEFGNKKDHELDFTVMASACILYQIAAREGFVIGSNIDSKTIINAIKKHMSPNLASIGDLDKIATGIYLAWNDLAIQRRFIENVKAGRVYVKMSRLPRGELPKLPGLISIANFPLFIHQLIKAYLNAFARADGSNIQLFTLTQGIELLLSTLEGRAFDNKNAKKDFWTLSRYIDPLIIDAREAVRAHKEEEKAAKQKQPVAKSANSPNEGVSETLYSLKSYLLLEILNLKEDFSIIELNSALNELLKGDFKNCTKNEALKHALVNIHDCLNITRESAIYHSITLRDRSANQPLPTIEELIAEAKKVVEKEIRPDIVKKLYDLKLALAKTAMHEWVLQKPKKKNIESYVSLLCQWMQNELRDILEDFPQHDVVAALNNLLADKIDNFTDNEDLANALNAIKLCLLVGRNNNNKDVANEAAKIYRSMTQRYEAETGSQVGHDKFHTAVLYAILTAASKEKLKVGSLKLAEQAGCAYENGPGEYIRLALSDALLRFKPDQIKRALEIILSKDNDKLANMEYEIKNVLAGIIELSLISFPSETTIATLKEQATLYRIFTESLSPEKSPAYEEFQIAIFGLIVSVAKENYINLLPEDNANNLLIPEGLVGAKPVNAEAFVLTTTQDKVRINMYVDCPENPDIKFNNEEDRTYSPVVISRPNDKFNLHINHKIGTNSKRLIGFHAIKFNFNTGVFKVITKADTLVSGHMRVTPAESAALVTKLGEIKMFDHEPEIIWFLLFDAEDKQAPLIIELHPVIKTNDSTFSCKLQSRTLELIKYFDGIPVHIRVRMPVGFNNANQAAAEVAFAEINKITSISALLASDAFHKVANGIVQVLADEEYQSDCVRIVPKVVAQDPSPSAVGLFSSSAASSENMKEVHDPMNSQTSLPASQQKNT